MSEVKHELRRYMDGFGLTHWVSWDNNEDVWYPVCNVTHNVPGKPDDDHDSRHAFPTCFPCMSLHFDPR